LFSTVGNSGNDFQRSFYSVDLFERNARAIINTVKKG